MNNPVMDEAQYQNYIKSLLADRGNPQSIAQLRQLGFTPEQLDSIMKGYRYQSGLREGQQTTSSAPTGM